MQTVYTWVRVLRAGSVHLLAGESSTDDVAFDMFGQTRHATYAGPPAGAEAYRPADEPTESFRTSVRHLAQAPAPAPQPQRPAHAHYPAQPLVRPLPMALVTADEPDEMLPAAATVSAAARAPVAAPANLIDFGRFLP